MIEPTLLTYPARPVNGGHLRHALKKVGAWSYEPKYNGWRAELHVPTGAMWNRHGKRLSIAAEFAEAAAILKKTPFEWLDVEALERRHNIGRGSLIVLDSPIADCGLRIADYISRRVNLHTHLIKAGLAEYIWVDHFAVRDNRVYLPPSYMPQDAGPEYLWEVLQESNREYGCQFYEGLVAKRNDSLYPIQLNDPDQTFSGWMKHRFVK